MSSEDAYASGPYHFAHRQEMLHAYFELLDSNAPTPYLPPSASATSASSTSFHSPFHLYPMLPHMPVSNSGPLSTDSSLANCPIARLDEAVHAAKFAEPIGYHQGNHGEVVHGLLQPGGSQVLNAAPQPEQRAAPKKRGPKKKPLTKEREVRMRNRRARANARERNRMHGLNHALESLRRHVPTFSTSQRLSKIETLRLAKNYIRALGDLLTSADSVDPLKMALTLTDGLSQNTTNLIAGTLKVSPRTLLQMQRSHASTSENSPLQQLSDTESPSGGMIDASGEWEGEECELIDPMPIISTAGAYAYCRTGSTEIGAPPTLPPIADKTPFLSGSGGGGGGGGQYSNVSNYLFSPPMIINRLAGGSSENAPFRGSPLSPLRSPYYPDFEYGGVRSACLGQVYSGSTTTVDGTSSTHEPKYSNF
uniref:Neurogenic differentiation factor 1 n=1 Tax=Schistocephalus solidus TaxID=70667 RepID=A0A0X3PPY7_SCHSO